MVYRVGPVAYFRRARGVARKDAGPQAHWAPCVKAEDDASSVIWPLKCQRIYAMGH